MAQGPGVWARSGRQGPGVCLGSVRKAGGGLLRLSGEASASRKRGFRFWIGEISWRRKWQPTPGFLPGEAHGQRSLADYSPRGCKESDTAEYAHTKRRQGRKERGFVFIQLHCDGQNLLISPIEHKALQKKKKNVSKNKEKKKNKQREKLCC